TSTNSVDWTRRVSRTLENLHGVGDLNGKLVTIGNRGTILQSARWHGSELVVAKTDAMVSVPTAGFQLELRAVTGRRHRLEASSNLINWTNIFTFTNAQDEIRFVDNEARSLPRRFYRLVTE